MRHGIGLGIPPTPRVLRSTAAELFRDALLSVSPKFVLIPDLLQTRDEANPQPGIQLAGLGDNVLANAHNATQATDSNQATLTEENPSINNRASLNVDGSTDYMSLAAGIGWSNSTSHTFISLVNPTHTSGSRYLCDAQAGRLVIASRINTANVGIYETAWRSLGAATTGWQMLEWQLDAVGTTVTGYRDGGLIGSTTYNPKKFAGVNVSWFAHYAGSSSRFEGDSATLFYKDGPLTAPERAAVYAAFGTFYDWSYSL